MPCQIQDRFMVMIGFSDLGIFISGVDDLLSLIKFAIFISLEEFQFKEAIDGFLSLGGTDRREAALGNPFVVLLKIRQGHHFINRDVVWPTKVRSEERRVGKEGRS